MDYANLRAWYWRKLGLDGSASSMTAGQVHKKVGWARSVGGVNPYIQVFARNGTTRESFDAQVAALDLHELPSARGCTYTVSKPDYALSLKISQGFADDAAMATAKRFLGVTDEEVRKLEDKVVEALAGGEMDPKQLKEVLGDAARNLGPEGKKRGTTTTLPLALGYLRTRGVIRNKSVNGRVDSQRYAYALWPKNPLGGFNLSREEAFTELTRRFFRWIGPAKPDDFTWFSGLGKGSTKQAIEPVGLVSIEPGSDWLIHPDELDAYHGTKPLADQQVRFVSALDNISHLRKCLADLIDPEDAEQSVPSDKQLIKVRSLQELWTNPIYDRGRLIGIWEFEPSSGTIAAFTWIERTDEVKRAEAEMEAFCRDQLGDARSFSLDGPESRQPRIDLIRQLAAKQ